MCDSTLVPENWDLEAVMIKRKTPMRAFRRTRLLSLDDVAIRTGVNAGQLSRIERGYSRPSARVKGILSSFFNLPDFILFPPDEEKRT